MFSQSSYLYLAFPTIENATFRSDFFSANVDGCLLLCQLFVIKLLFDRSCHLQVVKSISESMASLPLNFV